jgi:hypothetical protein
MAAAMAALEQTAAPVPIHKLPLQPIVPTATLAAACSGDGQQEQLQAAAAGSVRFQTHMFHILPHLAKLAAAETAAQAAADDAETAAATAPGSSKCISGPSAAAAAALGAPGNGELQVSIGAPGTDSSASDSGIAAGSASMAALAASAAEYMQQLKLNKVNPIFTLCTSVGKRSSSGTGSPAALNGGGMLQMWSRGHPLACCRASHCNSGQGCESCSAWICQAASFCWGVCGLGTHCDTLDIGEAVNWHNGQFQRP